MDDHLPIDDQIDIIIENEMDKLFTLSMSPGGGLDEKEVKKLETLVKIHELRRKNKAKDDDMGKLNEKQLKRLMKTATKDSND